MAQNQPNPPGVFTRIQLIGKTRPRDLRYDPQMDRFAWINAEGRLALVDATTYQDIALLTPDDPGTRLNDYRFSDDGKWLAVARDKQIDLWNISTAALAATFETDSTFGLEGPLWFSDDNRQLVFQSRVPAPQSTRRSENDTVLVPWVWDTVKARDEGPSELPNQVIAQPLFDYRGGGFILGKGRKAVAGLPSRLRSVEVTADGIQSLDEADDPNRIEVDPTDAWVSEADGWMMIRTQTGNLVQVDPETGQFLPILTGYPLQFITQQTVNTFHMSPVTQPIGPIGDPTQNPLRARLLGDDYRASYDYDPVTMYLIDVMQPITPTAGVPGLLVYTRNDRTGEGEIEFLTVPNSRAIHLHPNGRQLLIQDADGSQMITVYSLEKGTVDQVYYPNQTDADVVAYNSDGSALVVGLERFDTRTQTQTFYDPQYFVNTAQIFFSQDGQSLISLDNGTYQQWDTATGALIRQEYYYTRGDVLSAAPDGTRLLTRLDLPTNQTVYEVVDIAGGTRPLLTMHLPLNTTLVEVYPDATWEQFFVLLDDNASSRSDSGIRGALYRLGSSEPVWVVGKGDLPNDVIINWLDDKTLAFEYNGQTAPAPRVDNVAYAASGLPTCLVDGLPDAGMRWLDLWDFFNQMYDPTALDRLAVRLCGIVNESETPAKADAAIEAVLLSPTPLPTAIQGTPRPARIPGIPDCITQRFSSEALKYAQDWRNITVSMSEAQIAELAVLVCQGLTGDKSPQFNISESESFTTQYMTLDVNTLVRTIHNGAAPVESAPDYSAVIESLWYQGRNDSLGQYAVSSDGTRMARALDGFILVYSIDPQVSDLAATQTATLMPQGTPEKLLSVRPTATPPAELVQATYMPTLTPTWTPTPVSLPLSTAGPIVQVDETCPAERVPLASLSPDERPNGVLYVDLWNDQDRRYPWQLDLTRGDLRLRDDIPACNYNLSCSASPNNQWILYTINDVKWVSRWDGSEAVELFKHLNAINEPASVTWVNGHTLEWQFQQYDLSQSPNPITYTQRYDTETQTFTPAAEVKNTIPQIHNLTTELLTRQPIEERYDLLTVNVREGRRYYWYDRQSGRITLFLTLAAGENLFYQWQANGQRFFFSITNNPTSYVYIPATGQTAAAEYDDGIASPDSAKIIQSYLPTEREVYEATQNKTELPSLVIWNIETNIRTRYCLPGTDQNQGVTLLMWSPDSRYVLMQAALDLPDTYEVSRPALLILDTETGRVIDLGVDIEGVTTWTTVTAGDQP